MTEESKKPKIGARITRASFVGTLVGTLMFIVSYLAMYVVDKLGHTPVMDPTLAGIFGLIVGLSASLGIEFSKDLEQ